MVYQRLLEQRRRLTPSERRAFTLQIDSLIRNTGKLETDKVDQIVALLERARNDLRDLTDQIPKGRFSRGVADELKRQVERKMEAFRIAAQNIMGSSQVEFASLGSDFTQALATMQAQSPPIFGIPPSLIENAASRSADLITSLARNQIGRASDIINRGVITGKSPFEVARELSNSFNRTIPEMERIARTEMLGIHSQVQQAELEGMAKNVPGTKKQWIAVVDSRTRLSHRDAHLQSVPVDEPFRIGITAISGGVEVIRGTEDMERPRDPSASIGNVVNCVPAGTIVQGTFIGATRAFYSGWMVEVTTRAGHILAATVNHPAILNCGMVPFGLLRNGDYLVRDTGRPEDMLAANDYEGPATIKQVFDALSGHRAMRMKCSDLDFNGDASRFQGEVDVVGPACRLLRDRKATPAKGSSKGVFAPAYSATVPLDTTRAHVLHYGSIPRPAPSTPSGPALPLYHPAAALESAPLQELRLGPTSRLHARLYESMAYRAPGNPETILERFLGLPSDVAPDELQGLLEMDGWAAQDHATFAHAFAQHLQADPGFFRKAAHALPGSVALDEIVDIRYSRFEGHVYDLISPYGFMVANGLVESQCRCTMVPDFSEVNGDEPLSIIERPPVAAPLRGVGRKVAKSLKKGFRRLR